MVWRRVSGVAVLQTNKQKSFEDNKKWNSWTEGHPVHAAFIHQTTKIEHMNLHLAFWFNSQISHVSFV